MQDIVCSDIRMTELKLERIRLCKKHLLKTRPCRFNNKKLKNWKQELDKLESNEQAILKELQDAYIDLEDFL